MESELESESIISGRIWSRSRSRSRLSAFTFQPVSDSGRLVDSAWRVLGRSEGDAGRLAAASGSLPAHLPRLLSQHARLLRAHRLHTGRGGPARESTDDDDENRSR